MGRAEWTECFMAVLPKDAPVPRELEAELCTRVECGRRAWPLLALDAESFVGHLAQHRMPPVEHAADLYLACACAYGVRGAVEALDRKHAPDIRSAARRVDSSESFLDDVLQAVRERLLVATPGNRPKIGEYAGRAPLKSWLAAAAYRVALNLRRGAAERPHDELTSDVGSVGAAIAPELEYIRDRYKLEFDSALRLALSRLSPKQRLLLQLHLSDRLGIDQLAAMYKVGRSTAARWLAAAREAIYEETRSVLQERLELSTAEFDSLAALMRSDIEVSVVDALVSRAG
jgi:RNA polymerase sigma-70 factor (ECF subfamily)